MRRIYATFSGARYHDTTKRIVEAAPRYGADEVWVYDDHWLATHRPQYAKMAKHLLEHPRHRGVGWFAFKPFVLLDAVDRMQDDDVLLYTDADTYPIHDLSVLYEIGQRDGIMLFRANGWPHQYVWCKRDCFLLMGMDEPRYHLSQCGCARFMAFTKRHRPFLVEWLGWCLVPGCNTFDTSTLAPELPGHVEHRCEQAIMSLLAEKYQHRLYREACDSGEIVHPTNGGADAARADLELDRHLYPQLFVQLYGQSYSTTPCVGSAFRNIND